MSISGGACIKNENEGVFSGMRPDPNKPKKSSKEIRIKKKVRTVELGEEDQVERRLLCRPGFL